MNQIPAASLDSYPRMTTDELRRSFLIEGLFAPGEVVLNYWETDRAVVGGAVPTAGTLSLGSPRELAATAFCDRRELGIINLGGPGAVAVDGRRHETGHLDGLYVGRGARDVQFSSANADQPARFYLLSYPAHTEYPTTFAPFSEANGVALGSPATANARQLHKLIHPAGIKSCQLVMGYTLLKPGSVWNTLPPHTHMRRSEVYLYFDVGPDQAVFHFMGEPRSTRNLVVRNLEAVLSPPWSIHSGAGTASYGFVWGMGGENQEFADMDPAPVDTLQ
jgi:4-deoxy-L-threo-5-hexosulose-uronate ketol-isomerase